MDNWKDYLPIGLDNQEFKDAFQEYLDYRKERKIAPYTPMGMKKLMRKLNWYGPAVSIEAMSDSMSNNWNGIFPERITDYGKSKLRPARQPRPGVAGYAEDRDLLPPVRE